MSGTSIMVFADKRLMKKVLKVDDKKRQNVLNYFLETFQWTPEEAEEETVTNAERQRPMLLLERLRERYEELYGPVPAPKPVETDSMGPRCDGAEMSK